MVSDGRYSGGGGWRSSDPGHGRTGQKFNGREYGRYIGCHLVLGDLPNIARRLPTLGELLNVIVPAPDSAFGRFDHLALTGSAFISCSLAMTAGVRIGFASVIIHCTAAVITLEWYQTGEISEAEVGKAVTLVWPSWSGVVSAGVYYRRLYVFVPPWP